MSAWHRSACAISQRFTHYFDLRSNTARLLLSGLGSVTRAPMNRCDGIPVGSPAQRLIFPRRERT
jgi:hypothetical protein